ncbi:protein lingerer-like isoform X3 [Arctopsyche grandis]|uniref:protein lingerer-like isoform X3 n=1 Tax=Arctopsyche grandis TaxID=121162 RepID=UPI00406D71F6
MSLGAKTTNKGGTKSGGHQTQAKHNHVHKSTEKSQRAGRAAADAGGGEESGRMQHYVSVLIEMTCRSEEEVCSALHDCDNDLNKACEMLLEGKDQIQGQWQTNEKKKKKSSNTGNAVPIVAGIDRDVEDWNSPGDKSGTTTQSGGPGTGTQSAPREHRPPSRGRSSGRPYRGRGGESHVTGEDGEMVGRGGGPRRGPMGRGGGRGGGRGSSRGGRGSRPPRAPRHPQQGDQCWDITPNTGQQDAQMDGWGDAFPSPEDWDNEEWSGSLADTKVFTPSSATSADVAPVSNVSELSSTQINSVSDQSTIHNSSLNSLQQDTTDYSKQSSNAVLGTETSASSSPSLPPSIPQDPAIYAYTNSSHHLPKAQSPVAINVTGTLSAAQSQYLSQLTQKSEALKQERVMLNPQVYNSNYGVYGASELTNQRKPVQRARVPPPSKIPSSAVEMPGDLGSSSIGILDVQFGALDLASETIPFLTDNVSSTVSNSVSNADKYNTVPSALDHSLSDSGNGSVSVQQNVSLDSHQSSNTSSSLTNDVSAYSNNTPRSNQMLTSDSLSAAVSEHSTAGAGAQYGSGASRATPNVSTQHVQQLTTVAGLESQLTGKSSGVSDLSSQQSTYSTYPGQATPYGVSQPTKQTYHPTHHGYPANPYSQVNSSGTSFTAASSIASANAYAPTNTLNQYQHTQPLNTYQNSSSVSVYGNSLYTASSVPYNSYQTNNKITSNVKDSQYDNAVTSANNSLANSQSTQSSSKISTTSGKSSVSSSTSVMNSGSAGAGHVNTVMGQYMIGQPFFQPAYTYEELQLMQQRLPHHLVNPGYYDVSYGGGGGGAGAGTRDTPLASFASLGSGAEARFGRAEAPSPQAVAAGGAGAGAAQPPQAGMAPYAYYYSSNMLPGSFQPYSTQPLYPIATAGSTGSSSYGGGKGVVGGAGTYVGGAGGVATYGTPAQAAAPPPQVYETVQQQQPAQQLNSHQDYKSGGGYTSSQQSSGVKQGVSNSNTAANDLNNTMYGGKGHVSLSKVNSYEKAYHSATPPPPFGLNAAAGGVAGVGAGGYPGPQLYIPHGAMPPPPQQHQDNGTNNARGGASSQSKQGGGAKQGYSASYWAPN